MAKRRRELDLDGTTTEAADYNTVFVDTSLDTHLAILVSKSDTVSDFTKKIVLEHMQCFPEIEIHIQSLKVKRRAKFYHLPDSMHVWSAFHGVKGNWFLLVDASGTSSDHLNQNSSELAISDCMKMDVRNVDNNWKGLSSDINMIQTPPMSLPGGVTKKSVVSEMIPGFEVENSLVKTTYNQNSNFPEKNCMETKSPAKKKRKMRHTTHASFDASAKVLGVRNEQTVIDNKVAFGGTSVPAVAENGNVGSTVNCQDHLSSDERKEKTVLSIIPDLMASKKEYELGEDVQGDHSGVVSIKVSNLSARSMDASGAAGDFNSNVTKKKKKKAQKTATNIQDTSDVEQTLKGESIKPCTKTHKSEEKDEEKHFSLIRNHEVEMPSSYKALHHANPDLTQKEAPEITSRSKKKKKMAKKSANTNLEKSGIEQTDNGISDHSGLLCPSTGHTPEETDKEESILYPKGEDVQLKLLNGSTLDAGEKVLGANGNEANFVMSTQTKQTLEAVLDGKREMDKETQNSAGNGYADSPVLDKENQILEFKQVEKDSENTLNMDRKAKNKRRKKIVTTSDVQENLPVKDQIVGVGVSTTEENSISFVNPELEGIHVASSEVLSCKSEEKLEGKQEIAVNTGDLARTTEDSENTLNMDRKAKNKRRKKIVTTSDVQENLPVMDQIVGVGVSTTEENSISFVNPELEGIHVASSQVLSRKSEEKLEGKQEIAVNTGDLARTTEDEGEGINFKQYFVPGEYQDKVGSRGKVKKANQSNMEMKSLKKVKENGLPSVSISTEVQSSLNLSANQESEDKTPARKDSGKRQGDSAQNSDWDEVLPNSTRTKRTSRIPKNGVKDSSTSEKPETNIQKPKEILSESPDLKESPDPNKKHASLKKSNTERSKKIHGKRGNKMSQSGLNVTNRMEMKTPEKKSLLTKPGAIFHDNSGESSGDENGTAHSSGHTRSPSDSSSMSDYPVGESELSQDSTKNGSSDAQGRSTGAKDMSKLELSAPENITFNMILRSSKRFKKAKLMASQNETDQNKGEPIEFVPDSPAHVNRELEF